MNDRQVIPPEVRHCQNPDDPMFGAAAVAAGQGRWGIMHPLRGGHWAEDNDVADWVVIS
jgi:hypothetical protein